MRHTTLLLSLPLSVMLLSGVAVAQEQVVTGRLESDPNQIYPQRLVTSSGETFTLDQTQSRLYRLSTLTDLFRGISGREVSLRGVVSGSRVARTLSIESIVSPVPEVVEIEGTVLAAGRLDVGGATVEAFGPAASILGLPQIQGRSVTVRGLVFKAPGATAPSAIYVRGVQGCTHGARLRARDGKVVGWLWPGSKPWLVKLTDEGTLQALGGAVKKRWATTAIGLPARFRPITYASASRITFGEVVAEPSPAAATSGMTRRIP